MTMVFDGVLDSRLRPAETVIHDTADAVRPRSVAADRARTAVPLDVYPELMWSRVVDLGMPRRYGRSVPSDFAGLTETEQRTVLAYAGGYSDPSTALTLPGASLSGAVVEALGTPEQQDRFFGRWANSRDTRAFFAVTEPEFGTNAQLLDCRFDAERRLLSGTKRYIGNLVNASVGVVFVRTAPGPFGIGSVLLELPRKGAEVEAVSLVGMRAAGLGELRMGAVHVPEGDILGAHLPASRRGLWGMTRAFMRMRLQVASMALGAGSALLEEGTALGGNRGAADDLVLEGLALARLVWLCAGEAEAGVDGAAVRASLCKVACVDWATRVAVLLGGPKSPDAGPLVAKLVRDIVGMEFMEGVGPKQRQILASDWLRTKGVKSHAANN